MSKELFVTSTPHETKLAVVEDDQLVEVFFERENEYTLAGSIYKGRVTRVLPGMQSAFVDVGLERDAFLYVTDFLEEVEDGDDFETVSTVPRPHQQQTSQQRDLLPPSQPSAPGMQIEGDFTGADSDGIEAEFSATGEDQSSQPESEASAAPSTEAGNERGTRRWRGRRGRRRGRGAGSSDSPSTQPRAESASPEQSNQVVEQQESDEAEDSQQNFDAPLGHATNEPQPHFQGTNEVTEAHEHPDGARVSTSRPPRQERSSRDREDHGPERKPPVQSRPQPIILPGESLAKFNRKTEPDVSAQTKPDVEIKETRFQKAAPRPSTEFNTPAALLSTSHGVLAGESLAKYRNRPVDTEKEAQPMASHPPFEDRPAAYRPHQAGAHKGMNVAEVASEGLQDPMKEGGASFRERHSESAESHQAEVHSPAPARESDEEPTEEDKGTGDYKFSPGHGVIEEEEITEEEHEPKPYGEHLEDAEYEELEEETLEASEETHSEHHEDKMIAAGAELATALRQTRSDDGNTYIVEESGEDQAESEEDDGGEESLDAGEDHLHGSDELEPIEAFADSEHGSEHEQALVDPEDPNYTGRAETRAAAGTAGYQMKTERSGYDHRRGNRSRRGGKPPVRRGGPRRNIQRGPMPQINDLLKEGQEILVQIAKEPMAKKGARITSHIALPGRFLVFMPTVNHTGVSRKIGSEEERQRLKRILISEKGQNHGGFIVRTAASGASEEDLRADIRFLINLWNEIKQRSESSKAPALIYHDLNLVERILRDQVTSTFSNIWVDSEQEYERILRFASRFQPGLVRRVKLYTKDTPLFEQFNVQEEINKALKSKVWLKSGGYIVINQTEALVAIDINTGKYVGKTARLEDTIVKTNIDAIKEIVRQIRLRDLGGIIVIDFIDMDERKNRQKVMQALEEALKSDRSPSKVLQFNDFGLVAITRKRVKQSLERTLGTQCNYCTGTGMIKSVTTVCNEIFVELRKMAKHFENQQVMLRVNPEVAKALKETSGRWLTEMEEMIKKTIIVKSDPAQHQEQYDIN